MRHEDHRTARAALLLGAVLALASSGCATTGSSSASAGPDRDDAGARWGVEPLAVRRSAAGYMLDFRLRIIDREKAAPLLATRSDCYLVVEKTGARLAVARSPKIGPLRATVRTESMVKQGRVYGTLFANPGRVVNPGDEVTVVMGEFRAEHLVVQ